MYINSDVLREEGVDAAAYPKLWLDKRIGLAQQLIEDITGQFFEKRDNYVLTLDGNGKSLLHLPVPPVKTNAISKVEIDGSTLDADSWRFVASGSDWRDNPRIVRASTRAAWPRGYGNVVVTGSFGYVDFETENNVEVAVAPKLVRDLIARIAIWSLPKLTEAASKEREQAIIEESIEGYSYKLAEVKKTGRFGDSMIDGLLRRYTPIFMGTI